MSLGKFRQAFKRIDLFSTSQLLRYKEQPQYATLTGACLTLAIIILICLLVYQVLLHTINRNQINWSMQTTKEAHPSDLTMKMQQMKFGIEIWGLNLSDPIISYFDIQLDIHETVNGTYNTASVPLSSCQQGDWNTTTQIHETFLNLEGTNWLCPSPDYEFTLGGRWSSNSQKQFSISVAECGLLDSSKTNCADATQMAQLFADHYNQIYLSIMTVTALIQPDKINPISYYIEDDNYAVFGQTIGQDMTIDVADYTIETDNSLLPIQNIEQISGGFLSGKVKNYNIDPNDGYYVYVKVRKSPTVFTYERTFNKIDQTLSYAGGLIGVVVGLFFIMSPYTQLCYELSLSNQLFKDQQGHPLKTRINFGKYLLYEVYSLLKCCCSCLQSRQYDQYEQCSDQMQKQLDIGYLIKRIATLQSFVTTQLSGSNLPTIIYQRLSLEEAQKRAEKMASRGSQEAESNSSIVMVESLGQRESCNSLEDEARANPKVDLSPFQNPSQQMLKETKVQPRMELFELAQDRPTAISLHTQIRDRRKAKGQRGVNSRSVGPLKADEWLPEGMFQDD